MVCLCAQFAEYEPTELPFVHQPSKTSRKYLLESVGSGVALLDYDGDGRLDIYLVNGSALRDPMPKKSAADKREPVYWNRLYRNLGAGKWRMSPNARASAEPITEWARPRRTSTMTAIPTFM